MSPFQTQLSPSGTARERVLRAHGFSVDAGKDLPAIPDALRDAAGETLDPSDLYLAWELARCAGPLSPEEQRAVLHLCVVCTRNLRSGSTCLPLVREVLDKHLRELGSEEESASIWSLLEQARRGEGPGHALIGAPGEAKPLILDGDLLYLGRMHHLEDRLASRLRARMEAPSLLEATPVEAALADVLARAPAVPQRLELAAEQREAVALAARSPLAIVSGGPGTGKTSIVVSILRVLLRLGVAPEQIALAAPTGKAANRMQESLARYLAAIPDPAPEDLALLQACPEPRTLHRLLSYSPRSDRFHHHEHNPLAERVVIVDEASMIDLALLDQLVRAVRPEARLVLLGDAEQLPSVSAGAVLRDLVPAEELPAGSGPAVRDRCSVRLKKSYRMDPRQPDGLNILSAADSIRRGAFAPLREPGAAFIAAREDSAAVRFERMELLEAQTEQTTAAFLDRWFDARIASLPALREGLSRTYEFGAEGFSASERVHLARLFDHAASARVLCLTRGWSEGTGADFCNEHLHRRLVERIHGTVADGGGAGLRTGDPILMQSNDYERGLFNGDQGLVLMVRQGAGRPGLRAVFPVKDGFGVFPLARLPVQLCYAMTVHKAQGSEFDHVALVLPRQDLPLLSREVLYTAVTRARHSVTIVGTEELLRRGVERPLERHSGMARRLRG